MSPPLILRGGSSGVNGLVRNIGNFARFFGSHELLSCLSLLNTSEVAPGMPSGTESRGGIRRDTGRPFFSGFRLKVFTRKAKRHLVQCTRSSITWMRAFFRSLRPGWPAATPQRRFQAFLSGGPGRSAAACMDRLRPKKSANFYSGAPNPELRSISIVYGQGSVPGDRGEVFPAGLLQGRAAIEVLSRRFFIPRRVPPLLYGGRSASLVDGITCPAMCGEFLQRLVPDAYPSRSSSPSFREIRPVCAHFTFSAALSKRCELSDASLSTSQQFDMRSPGSRNCGGSSVRQRSITDGQRGAKGQPTKPPVRSGG